MSKTAFVKVAGEQLGRQGRQTNVSRTALLTGLPRREVRKERRLLEEDSQPLTTHLTKASLLLSAWHFDPMFRDKNGAPAILRVKGARKSFAALIASVGGTDVKPSTLLKELVSAGAVRMRRDGRLQAVMRDYIPNSMDEQLVRQWGVVMADVAKTYAHNLTRARNGTRRFERSAVNAEIPLMAVPQFLQMLNREGPRFLKSVDAWLTAHEHVGKNDDSEETTIRLGAGLYQIQD